MSFDHFLAALPGFVEAANAVAAQAAFDAGTAAAVAATAAEAAANATALVEIDVAELIGSGQMAQRRKIEPLDPSRAVWVTFKPLEPRLVIWSDPLEPNLPDTSWARKTSGNNLLATQELSFGRTWMAPP